MRPVTLIQLAEVQDLAAKNALLEIERASHEVDLVTIAQAFTITGVFTETRTLDAATATLADLRAFVATFIGDCQRGGQFRTT